MCKAEADDWVSGLEGWDTQHTPAVLECPETDLPAAEQCELTSETETANVLGVLISIVPPLRPSTDHSRPAMRSPGGRTALVVLVVVWAVMAGAFPPDRSPAGQTFGQKHTPAPSGWAAGARGVMALQLRRLERLSKANRRLTASNARLCALYDQGNMSGECAGVFYGGSERTRAVGVNHRLNGEAAVAARGRGTNALTLLQTAEAATRKNRAFLEKLNFMRDLQKNRTSNKTRRPPPIAQTLKRQLETARAAMERGGGVLGRFVKSEWQSEDPCKWTGVNCMFSRRGIRELTMSLNGTEPWTIPAELGRVQDVRGLNISGDGLQGFEDGWKWPRGLWVLKVSSRGAFDLPSLDSAPKLKTLKLANIRLPRPLTLAHGNVLTVHITNMWIPRNGIDLRFLPKIGGVMITGCDSLTEMAISAASPRLNYLRLHYNKNLTRLNVVSADGPLRDMWLRSLVIQGSPRMGALPNLSLVERLEHVELSDCGVKHGDLGLLPFRHLQSVDLSRNGMESLSLGPRSVESQKDNRISLIFDDNHLTELEPSLFRLKLERLLFARNNMTTPPSVRRVAVANIDILDCTGNPMCTEENARSNVLVRKGLFMPAWFKAARQLYRTHYIPYESMVIDSGQTRTQDKWQLKYAKNICTQSHVVVQGFSFQCNDANLVSRVSIIKAKIMKNADERMSRASGGLFDKRHNYEYRKKMNIKTERVEMTDPDLVLRALPKVPDCIATIGIEGFEELTSVPPALEEHLPYVEWVRINGTSITKVPHWLLGGGLDVLELPSNKIAEMERPPPGVKLQSRVRVVDLSDNMLVHTPAALSDLQLLRQLTLSYNPELESIDLRMTADVLPDTFSRDPFSRRRDVIRAAHCALKHVHIDEPFWSYDFSGNMLTAPPDLDYSMVRDLDLSYNMISEWNVPSQTAPHVMRLNLSHNRLSHIDFQKDSGLNLELMDASHNKLVSYRGLVASTTRLSHNEITELQFSDMFGGIGINAVDLSHNRLAEGSSIPALLASGIAKRFNTLDLSHNALGNDAMAVIEDFTGIFIDLSNNHIDSLDTGLLQAYFAFTKYPKTLCLDSNFIAGAFTSNISIPRVQKGARLDLDRKAVTDEAMREWEAMVLHSSEARITWVKAEAPMEVVGRTCSWLSTVLHPVLRLQECECAKDFYQSERTNSCEVCVPFAQCYDGKIHCSVGYYLDSSPTAGPRCVSCHDMEEGAECNDNVVIPRPGFWKPSINATLVYECSSSAACPGGVNSTSKCGDGHTGRLCDICEEGMYKVGSTCRACPGMSMSVLSFSLMSVGVVTLVVGLAVPGSFHKTTSLLEADAPQIVVEEASNSATALTKMLVAFMQVLVMVPLLYTVDFGQWLDRLSEWFEWMEFDLVSASALECLWEGFLGHIRYNFFHSMCMQAAVPVLVIGATTGSILLVGGVRRLLLPQAGISMSQVRAVLSRAACIAILFVYLPVSTAGSQFFKCVSFDGGATMYLKSDLSLRCYTDEWHSYMPVAVFILACYSVGVPAVIAVALFPWSCSEARTPSGGSRCRLPIVSYTRSLLKSMFPVYKKQYAWWEATELLRRLLVTSIAVHYSSSGVLQLVVAMVISFFALLVHMECRPFIRADLNALQTLLLTMLFVNLSIGLLKALDVSENARGLVTAAVAGLDVCLFVVMMCTICYKFAGAAKAMRRRRRL